MENETDVIRNQMLETRTSLTEKLEALEETVVATVQETTESVAETVQNVKEAVQETVETVSGSVQETVDTVKSAFDISKHVQDYPWAMFGGAIALGYLGGSLLPSSTTAPSGTTLGAGLAAGSGPSASGAPGRPAGTPGQFAAAQGSSWMSKVAETFGPVIHQVQGLAIGALAGVIGEMVMKSSPEGLRPQIKDMIQQVTTSLGGVPVEGLLEGTPPAQQQGPTRTI